MHGVRRTRLMQGLYGALDRSTFGDRLCPHCNGTIHTSYPEHLFTDHLIGYNLDTTVTWLENKDFKSLFELAEVPYGVLTVRYTCAHY